MIKAYCQFSANCLKANCQSVYYSYNFLTVKKSVKFSNFSGSCLTSLQVIFCLMTNIKLGKYVNHEKRINVVIVVIYAQPKNNLPETFSYFFTRNTTLEKTELFCQMQIPPVMFLILLH